MPHLNFPQRDDTDAAGAPDGARWAFEVKHDGYRFIIRRDGDRVWVFSRHVKDWTDRVPLSVEAMRVLPVMSATIDGEGVVLDDRGVTDFERLRSALADRGGSRAAFLYGMRPRVIALKAVTLPDPNVRATIQTSKQLAGFDRKELFRAEYFGHLDRIVKVTKRRDEQIPSRLMASYTVIKLRQRKSRPQLERPSLLLSSNVDGADESCLGCCLGAVTVAQ